MPNTHRPSPDWRDVYASLKDRIDSGVLARGAELPTMTELARHHGLSQHGARKVLERLRREGHAQSWQGLGYRVAHEPIVYRIERCPRFGQAMTRLGHSAVTRMIGTRIMEMAPELAHAAGGNPGRVARSEILRTVDSCPVALSRVHFPARRFPAITGTLAETGSVSLSLAVHGVGDYRRGRTRLRARLPDVHEARALQVPVRQAVIETIGVDVDADGEVVEITQSVWRADRVKISF